MAKKEKKKKLTKEERKRLKKEEQERLAREAEEARLQAEEEERQRLERERVEAEEQRLREAEERVFRRMQLIATDNAVREQLTRLTTAQEIEKDEEKWERYLRCDGLPDPLTRQEVTAYLSCWQETLPSTDTHLEVMRRTDHVLHIIDDLQQCVGERAYGEAELALDMADILQQYQDTQAAKLDVATYNVLTDLRPHIDLETNTVQFSSIGNHLSLALWSNCSKNLKNKGFFFKDLGVRFELPKELMDKDIAVRIMRTEYDHMSKFSRTRRMLDLAEFRSRETLSEVILTDDMSIEKVQEEAHRLAVEKTEKEAQEATEAAAAAAVEAERMKKRPGWMSASTSRSASPDRASSKGSPSKSPKAGKKKSKKKGRKRTTSKSPRRKSLTPVPEPEPEPKLEPVPTLMMLTESGEVNLRRYRVIGGLIQFDLLHIPPQPKVVGTWTLREVCEPQTVRRYPFTAEYRAPAPPEAGTGKRREPEEIEREIRQQEAEMQKLISTSVDDVGSQPTVAGSTASAAATSSAATSTAATSSGDQATGAADSATALAASQTTVNSEATPVAAASEAPPGGDVASDAPAADGAASVTSTKSEIADAESAAPAADGAASVTSTKSAMRRTGSVSRGSRVRISSVDGATTEPDRDGIGDGDGVSEAARTEPELQPLLEGVDYVLEVADHPENFPLLEARLPDSTLWFEPPFFVRWDEERSCWSTDAFYDLRYNEDTLVLQARTLRLGLFGLAVNRFSNLPYQSWSYVPTGPASGELSISAAVAGVKFKIQDSLVSLVSVAGATSNCLESYYEKPMKPEKLIQLMQSRGLDVFPEEDSYLYIEGSSLKHQPCEKHLYWCMALVGNAYSFDSSRWNLLAGAENMVFQFKEMLSTELQGNPALLLIRPRKATILECIETSQAWSEDEAPGIQYFSDLYHLVLSLGSEEAKARFEAAPCTFVQCLHTMLQSTRLLSYS